MNPAIGGGALTQAEETTVTETDIDVICGNQGALCEALYEWTDNELVAEGVSFLLGTPLKIVIIVLSALILNRITRKGIRRLTDRLGKATADHGDSVVTERSVERAEQRASTGRSLLRSLSTALIYGAALILMFEVSTRVSAASSSVLRRQLKQALDAAGIEMPNHQVDVWMRGEAAAA
jgi:small-conductance mechanosensitive channel